MEVCDITFQVRRAKRKEIKYRNISSKITKTAITLAENSEFHLIVRSYLRKQIFRAFKMN